MVILVKAATTMAISEALADMEVLTAEAVLQDGATITTITDTRQPCC